MEINFERAPNFGYMRDKDGFELGQFIYLDKPRHQGHLDRIMQTILNTYEKNPEFFYISADLETQGLTPHNHEQLLVSLCYNSETSIVFRPNIFDLEIYEKVLANVPIANQKLWFDYGWWNVKHKIRIKPKFCTLLASSNIYPGNFEYHRRSLDNIVAVEFPYINLDKSQQTSFVGMDINAEMSWDQVAYAAIDSAIVHRLVPQMSYKLVSMNLWDIFQIDLAQIPIVSDSEMMGVPVSVPYLEELLKEREQKVFEFTLQLQQEIARLPESEKLSFVANGKGFNVKSPKQVLELCKFLGYNVSNTSKDTINKLVDETKNPILKLKKELTEQRDQLSKFVVAYLEKHVDMNTKRVYPSWNISVDSGRMCISSDTKLRCIVNKEVREIALKHLVSNSFRVDSGYGTDYIPDKIFFKGNLPAKRVLLDDGTWFEATDDHRVMLESGEWEFVKNLEPGSKLMEV